MAWSGNGRVLIDCNWISRAQCAHARIVFIMLPWLASFAFKLSSAARVHTIKKFPLNFVQMKKIRNCFFFIIGAGIVLPQSVFIHCYLISVCRLVVQWLRGWLLWFHCCCCCCCFYFVFIPISIGIVGGRRCVRANKYRKKRQCKRKCTMYTMNYLFAQTNEFEVG